MQIPIPYHQGNLTADLDGKSVKAVLEAQSPERSDVSQEQLVKAALRSPVSSARLSELSVGASKVVVISSDHTRPVPSKIIMPQILAEIRRGNPDAEIVILVATGCHRESTRAELIAKYGEEIVEREDIRMHVSTRTEDFVEKGRLPSGGRLILNKLVDWADLLVAEGFIEPHFFAGFSGGRKSVMPGVASYETVLANHCAEFIAHPKARTGILEGNPIHADMCHAAKVAGLDFIVNVALDKQKRIIGAWAGHPVLAHEAGCEFVREHASIPPVEADIVITSNGGYPLDQNIYQAVKCMTAAEACVRKGGVIIAVSACHDGAGGEAFFRQSSQDLPPEKILANIEAVPMDQTEPDQWQTQILMRVLSKARVILVCDPALEKTVNSMHMQFAATIGDAMKMAETMVQSQEYVVIPDGVSVIVQ